MEEWSMEMLALILALSAVLWFLVDRFKPIWEGLSFGKYITLLVAGIGAFALVFSFNLDLILACGLVEVTTIAGKIITGLVLMSGSSAVAEIIERVKGK
jgi:hypothetical protein